jgi:hypothetical protein
MIEGAFGIGCTRNDLLTMLPLSWIARNWLLIFPSFGYLGGKCQKLGNTSNDSTRTWGERPLTGQGEPG